MKRRTEYIIFAIAAIIVIVGSLFSGEKFTFNHKQNDTINIGYNNYVESVAVVHLWKQLLEKKGYHVQLTQSEKAPLYAGLANGSVDVSPEVWLPTTDKPYYDKYKNQIELHDAWYKGTNLGLVVPKYMKDINSIEDLNKHKKEFMRNGKPSIVGIDAGASEMKLTQKVIKDYGLDFNLIQSSESGMMSELAKAYKDKKPVVVTLWNPHWAFNAYKLKYLKDPKNIYGKPETIYYASRKGFKKDNPKVTKYLDQWYMTHKQLGDLILKIEKSSPEKGAKQWIRENPDLVKKWLKD
ncbi:glycine betaine ABC transporter substrate-binding protein [Scopulibacillus cellulosilyticus]|uniref:Glycine betaine ABC transporter substrate-binding protein n=1 Tax=Scopulibacillus cellulosilyticus TaxID=2665665 RepID=A0ABW2PTI2_9BACL